MSVLEALLYGLVQGVTEYLPVSSSAHLILLPKFLGQEDPGIVFDVFLHLGTLCATLLYFWKDWWELLRPNQLKASFTKKQGVGIPLLVIATLPAVIAGILFHHQAETIFRGEGVLVVTLILGGLLLFLSDHFSKGERGTETATWKDGLIVGLFQCLSLVPGVSRSGSTMSGARILGLGRGASARLSFLMSAPITAGAIIFELKKNGSALFTSGISHEILAVAFFSTFFFGVVSIGFLMRLLKRFGFLTFAIYRIALAVVVYLVFRPY